MRPRGKAPISTGVSPSEAHVPATAQAMHDRSKTPGVLHPKPWTGDRLLCKSPGPVPMKRFKFLK